jgi:carbon storage regulator CsrA
MDEVISSNTGGFAMLVLTRKNRESIAFGRSDGSEPMLTLTVLGIGRGKVRLGFDADPSISVHRCELGKWMGGATDEPTDVAIPLA